jgi:hypothetical protein
VTQIRTASASAQQGLHCCSCCVSWIRPSAFPHPDMQDCCCVISNLPFFDRPLLLGFDDGNFAAGATPFTAPTPTSSALSLTDQLALSRLFALDGQDFLYTERNTCATVIKRIPRCRLDLATSSFKTRLPRLLRMQRGSKGQSSAASSTITPSFPT